MRRENALVGHIPPLGIELMGRALGQVASWLDVRHRRIVHQNIAFVFPHLTLRQRRTLCRRVFQHFGIMVLETIQAPFLSRDQLLARVRIENADALLPAMEHPRGCLVYSAHLGNWELGILALAAATGRSFLTVAKPIKLQPAHRWLTVLRSRYGNEVVSKKGAMPVMQKALRAGRTVALLVDQGVRRSEAVDVTFLGRPTMATPAPALLALRGRMPVVPMSCTRSRQGRYRLTVHPPVTFERSGDLHRDIRRYTEALLHALEGPIGAHPEQWFWFHKRWKRTHPELYPEYQIRRRRKRIKKGLEI